VVVGVLEPGLCNSQITTRGASSTARPRPAFLEDRTGLSIRTGGDEVVEEAGEIRACTIAEGPQVQGTASGADPDLREMANMPAMLRRTLLPGRPAESLGGRRREGDRLVALARDVQCDRRRSDDLAALWM